MLKNRRKKYFKYPFPSFFLPFYLKFFKLDLTIIEKFRVYQPILDTKNFWARKKDFTPLEDLENEGNSNITIYFNTYWYLINRFYHLFPKKLRYYKYLLEVQMGVSNQMYDQWGMDLNNMEEIKEMIMETNLYLVITTMVVSFLHSIFEFLAIKNGKKLD